LPIAFIHQKSASIGIRTATAHRANGNTALGMRKAGYQKHKDNRKKQLGVVNFSHNKTAVVLKE